MLYGGRQHRRSYGNPGLRDRCRSFGIWASNFVTFDAHDSRVQNAVPYGFDNDTLLSGSQALFNKPDIKPDCDHLMVVSLGAMSGNMFYASVLGWTSACSTNGRIIR